MYFLVRDIVEQNMLEGARIAAGEKGICNKVFWINLMEILDTPDSLQKGELLVTTGYQLDDEKRHKDLVLQLKNRGISGIVIQPGYYIQEIPQYILDTANQYSLPVIELPKSLTFSHIMHVLLENIGLQSNPNNDSEILQLRKKCMQSADSNLQKQAANSNLHLFFISPSSAAKAAPTELLLKGIERIKAFFQAKSTGISLELAGSKALLAVSLKESIPIQDAVFELSNLLLTLSKEEHVDLVVGCSACKDGKSLTATFDEALEGNEVLKKIEAKRGVCPYNNIDFFELLQDIAKSNRSVMLSYDAIKELYEYDKLHNSTYLQTLKMYLANECGSTETSAKLFIHRHTLKNRLDKITELSAIDLKDYYARVHLSMALLIYDYFSQ